MVLVKRCPEVIRKQQVRKTDEDHYSVDRHIFQYVKAERRRKLTQNQLRVCYFTITVSCTSGMAVAMVTKGPDQSLRYKVMEITSGSQKGRVGRLCS